MKVVFLCFWLIWSVYGSTFIQQKPSYQHVYFFNKFCTGLFRLSWSLKMSCSFIVFLEIGVFLSALWYIRIVPSCRYTEMPIRRD